MNITLRACMGGAFAAAALSLAPSAWAGCGDAALDHAVAYEGGGGAAGLLVEAAYTPPSIVGMWSITFTGSNGAAVDFGYQQWHSDGTELLNSGGRSPASENFCMGVWGQLGLRRFALNHWALGYDPSTGKLNAKVNIKADVTVDAGDNTFSGPFTQDVYDPASGKALAHIAGTLRGQRVTLSTAE